MIRSRMRAALGMSAIFGLLALSSCDLSETSGPLANPGSTKAPGTDSPLFATSDWSGGRVGTILTDSADWFRVDLKKDSMYSITVRGLSKGASTPDVRVEVYSGLAYEVWASDGAAGGADSAFVQFRAPLSGPVRVRVSVPGSTGWGSYEAIVRSEDTYELDGTMSAANTLPIDGLAQGHRISQTDTDWVVLETKAGEFYELVTRSLLIDIDAFDATKHVVVALPRYDLAGSDKIWSFTATGSKTYVRVTGRTDTTAEGTYTLKARHVVDDSWEPDDTASSAKSIVVGQTQNRVLLPWYEDWIKFEGKAYQAYHVKATSDVEITLDVVDSVGNRHGTRTGKSIDLSFLQLYRIPVYVQVHDASAVARYSITVTESDTTLAPVDPIDDRPNGPI